MNKKVLILLMALIVLMAGAAIAYRALAEDVQLDNLAAGGETVAAEVPEGTGETAATENLAPDFTVYDREGNAHSLSDFRGQPVIVNFWASWCGPCKAEMPDFEEAYLEYGDEIQFLIVDLTDGVQETVASASEYIAQQGYTFPVFYDTDLSGARSYEVYAIPVTYFIDAQGCIRATNEGMIAPEQLQQNIEALLAAE